MKPDALTRGAAHARRWLDRPLSLSWCVLGWLASSLTFVGLAVAYGGPSPGDSAESVYSTWSFAHGNVACFYPPLGSYRSYGMADPFAPLSSSGIANPFALVRSFDMASPSALTAPLYPLLSGVAAWISRIGDRVGFPSANQLGPGCANAVSRIYHWSLVSGALHPTLWLAFLVWPILLAGIVTVLRVSGRGRSGWEPLALLVVAVTPCVLMCITYFFHPEDLLAMGLLLLGVAAFLRKKWIWVGVLVGLAVCAQQFALLVAMPLLVLAPSRARRTVVVAAASVVALIDVPLVVASSGRGLRTILLGSNQVGSNIRSFGGTVLWETDLSGPLLFLISRVLPIAVVTALAWWASRRLGERLLEPTPLMSLLASALVVRLVFEENLFGYYFMAAAVSLIVLDVVAGRVRGVLLAWLAVVALAFSPVYLGYQNTPMSGALPFILVTLVLASLLIYTFTKRLKLYETVWFAFAVAVCEFTMWGLGHRVYVTPTWWWQVTLVPTALALALSPLVTTVRASKTRAGDDVARAASR